MQNNNFSITKYIPSLFTIASLFFGLSAINLAIHYEIAKSIYFIVAAAFCDFLDGRMARLLNATSEFGGELDSLSDFASFSIAPAFILYYGILDNIYPFGWITVCFFAIAGMLRLARFNISDGENKKYEGFFIGIPVPAAALLSFLPFYSDLGFDFQINNFVIIGYLIVIALLMVSSIPTFSTKKLKINKLFIPLILALISLLILLLIYYTWITLLILGLIYLASIPITIFLFIKKNEYYLNKNI